MQEKIQHVVSSTAYATGGTTAVFGMFGLNEWALVIGIVATVATAVANLIYKHLHYKLAKDK